MVVSASIEETLRTNSQGLAKYLFCLCTSSFNNIDVNVANGMCFKNNAQNYIQ